MKAAKSPWVHRLKNELTFHVPIAVGPFVLVAACSGPLHTSVPLAVFSVIWDDLVSPGSASTRSHSAAGAGHALNTAVAALSHAGMRRS